MKNVFQFHPLVASVISNEIKSLIEKSIFSSTKDVLEPCWFQTVKGFSEMPLLVVSALQWGPLILCVMLVSS